MLEQAEYKQLAQVYEQLIETEPEQHQHYWFLGLAYLLDGRESEAQVAWATPLIAAPPEVAQEWQAELLQILAEEATAQEVAQKLELSQLIRQHLRELAPTDLPNVFQLLRLGLAQANFEFSSLEDWQVLELLQSCPQGTVELNLLDQVLTGVLEFWQQEPEAILAFAAACLAHTDQPYPLMNRLMQHAIQIGYGKNRAQWGVRLVELCRNYAPQNLEVVRHLANFYTNAQRYSEGIEAAASYAQKSTGLCQKLMGYYLLMRAHLSAGRHWTQNRDSETQYQALIAEVINGPIPDLKRELATFLIYAPYFLPYLEDNPRKTRALQNDLAAIALQNIQAYAPALSFEPAIEPLSPNPKRLKVGYIAKTFTMHSVGWLCRWLFQHHCHERFEIFIYFFNSIESEFTQQWFVAKADHTRVFSPIQPGVEVAAAIAADQLDLLVDLDSLTLDLTCEVMALKPAPVQVTWLGWDASGLPTIDYFIADPYVLPENAQDYYREKIWRLPQTYLAVDGFEIGVPTLRRDALDIPADAVIYYTGQTGYKRHPEIVRLQLQILQQVPQSYLLIKGLADEAAVQELFIQLATEVGVAGDRLRFLPRDINEFTHRANLQIADVVLDTYPYNGATTTLETLWLGIPLVTQVGQQFAARNSYTFLMNLGVREGIAWSAAEYVEWGIRFGTDAALRQGVTMKILAARQTSPLWDAESFCREMERAYEQMCLNPSSP